MTADSIMFGAGALAASVSAERRKRIENTPSETDSEGNRFWRDENGQLHREDGPAFVRASGIRGWLRHGQPHREDGPAFEDSDGSPLSWWLDGEMVTAAEVQAGGGVSSVA